MKEKIGVWLLVLLIPLSIMGCATASQSKKIEIELIVKGKDTEFWRSVENGANAGKSNYGIDLRVSGPELEKDYKEQRKYMADAINRKPDAIVLAAGDYLLMEESVAKAKTEGIPVFIVDSAVAGENYEAYIGTDNEQLGIQLAKEVNAQVTSKGKVGVISFVEKSYPSVLREAGVRNMLKDSALEILETVYCDSNIEMAEKQTLEMLATHSDLVAIMGLNAQSATGAARALKKANRTDIFLGGIDCSVEEADYLQDEILNVVVLQNPYLMGYFSIETAFRYLNGQKVDSKIWVGSHVVDNKTMFSEENQQLIFPFK